MWFYYALFSREHTGYIDINVVLMNFFAGRLLGT